MDKPGPHADRLRFLADRMALLMVELVQRDFDYGPHCFDEFYEGEVADHKRKSREYEICIDFVRRMLRRRDRGAKSDAADSA